MKHLMIILLALLMAISMSSVYAGAEELFDPEDVEPNVVHTDYNNEYWDESVGSSGFIDVTGYETVRIRLADAGGTYVTMWDEDYQYVDYLKAAAGETVILTPDGTYRYIRFGYVAAAIDRYSVKGYAPGWEPEKYRTFSILGDSVSAFVGAVYPETNSSYYPKNDVTEDSVTQAEELWWYLFAESYGCELQTNASFAGSCISNAQGWNADPDNRTIKSFIDRLDDVAPAELIIIEGGINDCWKSVEVGEPVYSGWTEEQLEQFAPALAYCIDYLQRHHEGTDIVFLTCSMTFRNSGGDYPAAIREVCEHYGVPVISVSFTASAPNQHPGTTGQRQLAEAVESALIDYLNF